MNNLKQLSVGLLNFESANKKFPAGQRWSGPRTEPGTYSMAWSAILLPFIEQQALADQLDFKIPFTDPKNMPVTSQVISGYLCPSTSAIEEHRSPDARLYNMTIPGEGLGMPGLSGNFWT